MHCIVTQVASHPRGWAVSVPNQEAGPWDSGPPGGSRAQDWATMRTPGACALGTGSWRNMEADSVAAQREPGRSRASRQRAEFLP